jgi:hypothetical protein
MNLQKGFKVFKSGIISLCNFLIVKYAIQKARRLHRKYNCQIFVVKYKGKIRIMSKYQFTQMRQHGHFDRSFTAENLKKLSIYFTPKTFRK